MGEKEGKYGRIGRGIWEGRKGNGRAGRGKWVGRKGSSREYKKVDMSRGRIGRKEEVAESTGRLGSPGEG